MDGFCVCRELRRHVSGDVRNFMAEQTDVVDDLVIGLEQGGALTLSLETREVSAGNTVTKLTPKEFNILHHLILHFGEVLSSKDLLQQVWGYPSVVDLTTDVVCVPLGRLSHR